MLARDSSSRGDRFRRGDLRIAAEEIPDSGQGRGGDIKAAPRFAMELGCEFQQAKQVGLDRDGSCRCQLVDPGEFRVRSEDGEAILKLIDEAETLEDCCWAAVVLAQIQKDLKLRPHGAMGEVLQPLVGRGTPGAETGRLTGRSVLTVASCGEPLAERLGGKELAPVR